MNFFVENVDDKFFLYIDVDNRLEKIVEKVDDDIGENINKLVFNYDIMLEDFGFMLFEVKKDIFFKL